MLGLCLISGKFWCEISLRNTWTNVHSSLQKKHKLILLRFVESILKENTQMSCILDIMVQFFIVQLISIEPVRKNWLLWY